MSIVLNSHPGVKTTFVSSISLWFILSLFVAKYPSPEIKKNRARFVPHPALRKHVTKNKDNELKVNSKVEH